ncbi:MAG: FecR domain-containing protein [Rhodospirillales bacterium]|nr:FecR domain-containing protein [Rhodospirillales bacterium]
MGRAPIPANSDTPATASDWLIALGEQPADEELRDRFDAWLAASPDHRRDWAEISRTAEALGQTEPAHQHEWGEFVRQRKAERVTESRTATVGRRRRRTNVIAALAVAACLAFIFGGNLMLRIEADHMTATAEQRRVHLADGTVVLLAPESAIDIAYDEDARRVRLLKGRAYFEVVADRRPFAVQVRQVEARDIGTAFDVGLDARGVDVGVREGIVDVSAARVPEAIAERLQAGDWVRVTTTGRIERGRLPADQVASWMQGQLVVKNRPVGEVVDALRPYFAGLVVLRGAALADQPLTGVYNLADPVEALRAVARAQGATLHRISPWLIVISAD